MTENSNQETRNAFLAIVGKPNVGKSSLLNALLGEKVAIVTSKPQTTRTRITGVLTKGPDQYVFLDTPGLHRPKNKLGDQMVKAVQTSVRDVDAVVMVVEPYGELTESEEKLLDTIRDIWLPAVLVINKIDTLKEKTDLLARMDTFGKLNLFDAVFPVSVLQQKGLEPLMEQLSNYLAPGPHFFPDDALTDQPERVIMAELLREQLLLNLRQEIPHGTAVVIEKMRERENQPGLLDIDATIYCERPTHKGMIIGKGGSMLKTIASQARAQIEQFLQTKVNLTCWVKVKEAWRNKDGLIRNFGLNFGE